MLLPSSQSQENPIRLKQINAVKTNFKLKKVAKRLTKQRFQRWKIHQIKTSDVVQKFLQSKNLGYDRKRKSREVNGRGGKLYPQQCKSDYKIH
jgi:hypothetical protein